MSQVVIVTGAASGIGFATARRFAKDGANVVLVGLHQDKLADAAAQVRAAGAADTLAVVCDVSVEADVERAVRDTLARFGNVDAIVNNAGLMSFKPLHEFTGDDWTRIL